jgi:hypothetical protein
MDSQYKIALIGKLGRQVGYGITGIPCKITTPEPRLLTHFYAFVNGQGSVETHPADVIICAKKGFLGKMDKKVLFQAEKTGQNPRFVPLFCMGTLPRLLMSVKTLHYQYQWI